MTQSNEVTQEMLLNQIPFSAVEWEQTPKAVQEFILSLMTQVQALEVEVATLRERVNRNSRNSFQRWT
jgi:hypothetical protein